MNIYISGSNGYLGSCLAKALLKKTGFMVYALIRNSSDLKRLEGAKGIVYVNMEDEESVNRCFSRFSPDIVINTATAYGRKGESLEQIVEANITFPCRLYGLAEKYGAKTFINVGTSLPDDASVYALTKNTFAKLASVNQQHSGGMKFINIRLEHFYGPGSDASNFVKYVASRCIGGISLDLTSGVQKRDFIFIEDVVSAFEFVIANLEQFNPVDSIDVGSGEVYTVREVVDLIAKLSKSSSKLNYGVVALRDNEPMYSCANVDRLASLGWQSKFTLDDGLKTMLANMDIECLL